MVFGAVLSTVIVTPDCEAPRESEMTSPN